ncbi:hypothetical protein [Longispora albida]|uniref:hypothetical protein n=1 Tax=Longispora albida TaxID=203523 RepID=UPI00036289F6|nr:hypothetical protein [Longispora albida]
MFLTIGSLKGSPGATTVAVGLTALWPGGQAVLVEADPAGGDLAARFAGTVDPGLTTLAAASRTGTHTSLADHAQQLAGIGAHAVLAPPGDTATAAATALASASRTVLAQAGHPVIADVGRLTQGGPGLVLAAASDLLLLVIRPTVDEQAQLAARLPWLIDSTAGRLGLVLSGAGPYTARQISDSYGLQVHAHLSWHENTAGVLSGRTTSRFWQSMRLAKQLAALAADLAAPAGRHAAPRTGASR